MIHTSPVPPPTVPDVSLSDYVLHRAALLGDRPAFIDAGTGRAVSFMQLAFGAPMAAAGLRERGLRKGDVVAIYLPNIPEYAAVFHAVALAGGVSALFSPLLSGEALAQHCQAVGARFVVTVGPLLPAARATGLELIGVGDAPGTTPFLSLLSAPGDPVQIDPARDLVALVLSSGTEGAPKPVRITHQNLVAGLAQIEALGQFSEADTFLGLLPFTHVYGALVGMCLPTRLGATTVTLLRFELHDFLGALSGHRISVAHLVPPLVLALARHPAVSEHDLSALRLIISGASHLPAELGRDCAARLSCEVVDGYGLSEAGATHVVHDYAGGAHLGSVGQPLPLTRCRLVEPETGRGVEPGAVGEIQVSGPCLSPGYWGEGPLPDAEGWLHTGDLGRVDAQGRLFVVDRIKELVKCGGVSIAPAPIEERLRAHPAVADAAVLGAPDAILGEVPVAFVSLRAPLDPEALYAWTAAQLPPDHRLRRVLVVPEIPRSPAGKILRRQLRLHLG